MTKQKFAKTCVAGACLLAASGAWAAAGVLLLSEGAVNLRAAGGEQRLGVAGGAVEVGDTVLTQQGRTQIRFTDGSLVSLQPNTEFRVENYTLVSNGGAGSSLVMNLLRGGLRTITGLIGRLDKSAYRMNTKTATIGIRGTEFQAVLCEASCKEPDGLYVRTGEGSVVLTNTAGELVIARGQAGFVASPVTPPARTNNTPVLTAAAGNPQTLPPVLPSLGLDSGFQVGAILSANDLGSLTVLSQGGAALASSGSLVIDGVTTSSNETSSGSGVSNGSGTAGYYLVNNAIRGFVVQGPDAMGSITVDSVKSAGTDGSLYWGRWTGTNLRVNASGLGTAASDSGVLALPDTFNLHYIVGNTVPTIPTTGMATFNFVGGTPSTDASGGIGAGITGGALTADYVQQQISGSFSVSHGASSYAVTAAGLSLAAAKFGGTGTATGPGIYNTTINGFLSGTGAPTGAGLAYSIQSPSAISGVGAFKAP